MTLTRPTQNILVYGTGVSAKYYIEQHIGDSAVLAVVDEYTSQALFHGYPVIRTTQISELEFDAIVVASWAIQDIAERLLACGVTGAKILWFQHNKNRVVSWEHTDATLAHTEPGMHNTLYAFYDLDVARATYDILGFLCLADIERAQKGLQSLHLVVVNASNNEFNVSARGVINVSDHLWRKRQILMQSAALLADCHGVTVCSSRQEAELFLAKSRYVFPASYRVNAPLACWEFNHLFDAVGRGADILRLRATPQAKALLATFLQTRNVNKCPVITITLRESQVKPLRNSNQQVWIRFASMLQQQGYYVVLVPDTEQALTSQLTLPPGVTWMSDVCFNLELRMALYELSQLNLGVNNGPFHLCVLSPVCRYIMFKQITEDYVHTSRASFVERGFAIGEDFPGAKDYQKLVWADDELDVIDSAFQAFVDANYFEQFVSDKGAQKRVTEWD